ncbi:GNAT family N-acetyltransferase [Congregibacter brevis]|uniref:GNAT family N-acetyltransferase n=1 Tax=Congregibacter brevis TaxID=3081201 RepID=A0ABZ0IFJ2_9GAMM|nr:GNAT family N-acetyltransferase [Congregibacter sp. IMCC45268]
MSESSVDNQEYLEVRRASDSDAVLWDQFVSSHPNASPYHRWAWKLAMEDSYGLKTHYYIAISQRDGIAGVLPAARIPSLLGASRTCSLPYCDLGQPLTVAQHIADRLLETLQRDENVIHQVRASCDVESSLNTVEPKTGQKFRLLLDLPENPADLFSGFKSKHRSQINKAKKNGLVATLGNSPYRVKQFYSVFTRNMRNLGSPTHSLAWFLAIAQHYADNCTVGLVMHGDEVIAGGLVLFTPDKAAIPWASTLREFNKLSPNMLLYWSLLEHATERKCKQFDFGRSSYGEGTYRFKTQWGAEPLALRWVNYDKDGNTEEVMLQHQQSGNLRGTLRRTLEAVWRHVPLPVTIALGSRFRPFVSL